MAYVLWSRFKTRKVFLCDIFFDLPNEERASTIFHELTHFKDLTATTEKYADHVDESDPNVPYSAHNQELLVQEGKAIHNAQNWESFATVTNPISTDFFKQE